MENRRAYRRNHPHLESPESKKKPNRKYRISSYGLTQEQFDRLLEALDRACVMCHTPFKERQPVWVDHDHACCPGKNRSCGKCVRGLLCLSCNISLGYSERRYAMARACRTARPPGCSPPPSINQEIPFGETAATCLDENGGPGRNPALSIQALRSVATQLTSHRSTIWQVEAGWHSVSTSASRSRSSSAA
jgi:hypothetical protein